MRIGDVVHHGGGIGARAWAEVVGRHGPARVSADFGPFVTLRFGDLPGVFLVRRPASAGRKEAR